MKKRFTSSYIYLFFTLLILNSCQKDLDIIIPADPESYKISLFGTNIDEDANPLPDAQVIYNEFPYSKTIILFYYASLYRILY